MRLTVGIPARDAETTIGHVLRAVLRQVEEGDRVLVVDDGSIDGTADLAAACGAEVIRHEMSFGLAVARNTLLSHAGTELIAYLDADAVPAEGTIAVLRGGFADKSIAGTGGRGVETDRTTASARWRAAHCPQDHGERPIESDWMLMGLCCCYATEALRRVGGFDAAFGRYGEDAEIGLRLRKQGHRLRYLPGAVVYHMKPDGLRGVLRQGAGHAFHAARALAFHGEMEILAAYRRDIRMHLSRVALTDIARGHLVDAGIGLANLAARWFGVVRGARYRSP